MIWLIAGGMWLALAAVNWYLVLRGEPSRGIHGDVAFACAVLCYLVAKVESLVAWWMYDTEAEETVDMQHMEDKHNGT